jgi:hypothetical protein
MAKQVVAGVKPLAVRAARAAEGSGRALRRDGGVARAGEHAASGSASITERMPTAG